MCIHVVTGTDTPESVTATVRPSALSERHYCFQVEAKLDGRWYWSVCVCHDVSMSVSGIRWSKVEAVQAAEAHVREFMAMPDRSAGFHARTGAEDMSPEPLPH